MSVINNGNPRLFDWKIHEINGMKIKVDNQQYSGNIIKKLINFLEWYRKGDIDIKSIRKVQTLFVKGDDGIGRGIVIQSASDIAKNGHQIFVNKTDSSLFLFTKESL